jgi:cytochrome c-type biogenesis protein CcmH
MRWVVLSLLVALAAPMAANAVQPDEILADPHLEARARTIGKDLRCLVCQNQSIDDSDAELAHDLRLLVRERLKAGDTDDQVRQYLVDRYGDYVLLRPPLKATTVVLWLGAPVMLLFACGAAVVFMRSRRGSPAGDDGSRPLTAAERRRLATLTDGEAES